MMTTTNTKIRSPSLSKKSKFPTITALEIAVPDRLSDREAVIEMERRSLEATLNEFDASKIGSFVMTSSTGYEAPSLELLLPKEFNLSKTLRRTFVGHMGCHAAFNAIKIALDSLVARPHEAVLVTCTDCSSVHMRTESSATQSVSHALFGDATVSMLMTMEDCSIGLQVIGTHTESLYENAGDLGLTIANDGFRMWVKPQIPYILEAAIEGFVKRLLEPFGVDREQIKYWGIHPGGPKILRLIGQVLKLSPTQMRPSQFILENYGNCASPTILMILHDLLKIDRPQSGDYGIMLAFGPSLTIEGMLLRF
jgi:predicted naringenin-chalcone synthase